MATLKTPAQIIDIAKLSQFYAANFIGNGSLFSPELDPRWARILYVERKSLEWMYDLDPTNSTLQKVANYVYRLCGRAGLKAAAVLGGGAGGSGTIITPTTPTTLGFRFLYLIPITAADFTTATEYDNPDIAGKELQVFWNNIDRYLEIGTELLYTPTGFTVFIDDGSGGNSFNAFTTNTDAEFKIYIVHPEGTSISSPTQGYYPYTGIGGETSFSNSVLVGKTVVFVLRGTAYGVVASSPATNEVMFDTTTGTVTFNSGNPINAGEFIIVPYS